MVPGLVDKGGGLLAGSRGTHNEGGEAGDISLAIEIGLEELHRFLDNFRALGDNAKAAAMIDIHMDEIERQQEQRPAIDNHHLAVIANQIVRGAPYGNASLEKTGLQTAQLW